MNNILNQYKEKINGVFSFFDRMILTGHLRPFFHAMLYFLSEQNVLLKDYGSYAQGITENIKEYVRSYTDAQKRPLIYLNSPKTSKEQAALKCLEDSLVTEGLVCTISTVEMCNAFSVIPNKATHKLEMKCVQRKCLHYYFYYLDRVYGFMFVKLQTWFPFTVTVYINGRELRKKAFDDNGITYSMYDNSFSFISDIGKAQELADRFDSKKLSSHLDHFAERGNAFLPTVKGIFGSGYYWCASQIEYATDVMFQSREAISDGKYLISGFTNKAIRQSIYPSSYCDKKIRNKMTRLLKKLRIHGLVRKVPHSHRYHVSEKGRRIINSLIEVNQKYFPEAMAAQ